MKSAQPSQVGQFSVGANTIKHWMGSTHFLTKTIGRVSTEMSLHVLAYNLKRVMSMLGITETMKVVQLARA